MIYDDEERWSDSSWSAAIEPDVASPVRQGERAIKVTLENPWAVLAFRTKGLDTTPYTDLQLALHPVEGPLPKLRVTLYDAEGKIIKKILLNPYIVPAEGGWHVAFVPLSDLEGENTTITRIAIQNASGQPQPPFYIDGLGLVSIREAADVIATPGN